jgi:hypothetical protein
MPFSPRTNYGDRRGTADDDSAPGAYAAHRLTSLPVIEGWGGVTKIDQIGRPPGPGRRHHGGKKALADAWDQFAKDPIRYAVVVGAFYPMMVREALRDQMAEAGITEEDLRDLIRKLERNLEGGSDREH